MFLWVDRPVYALLLQRHSDWSAFTSTLSSWTPLWLAQLSVIHKPLLPVGIIWRKMMVFYVCVWDDDARWRCGGRRPCESGGCIGGLGDGRVARFNQLFTVSMINNTTILMLRRPSECLNVITIGWKSMQRVVVVVLWPVLSCESSAIWPATFRNWTVNEWEVNKQLLSIVAFSM